MGTCAVCAGADAAAAGDDGDDGEHGGVCSDANSDIGSSGMGGKRRRRWVRVDVGDVKRVRADVVCS